MKPSIVKVFNVACFNLEVSSLEDVVAALALSKFGTGVVEVLLIGEADLHDLMYQAISRGYEGKLSAQAQAILDAQDICSDFYQVDAAVDSYLRLHTDEEPSGRWPYDDFGNRIDLPEEDFDQRDPHEVD